MSCGAVSWRGLAPLLGVLALSGGLTACGGAAHSPVRAGSPPARPARAAPAPPPARASASACARAHTGAQAITAASAGVLAATRRRYRNEQAGPTVQADLRALAGDRTLLRALQGNDFAAALAEANRQLVSHVVRIRVWRAGRVVVDANPHSFAVAGSQVLLRTPRGRVLGRLAVTLQDIIGFIKLARRRDGAAGVVVRAAGGQVRASPPGIDRLALPRRGCVSFGGGRYLVHHFTVHSFTGAPLQVTVLTGS